MATITEANVEAVQEADLEGPEPTIVMECKPCEPTLSEGQNGGFKSNGHYRILQARRPKCFKDATSDTAVDMPPQFVSVSGTHIYARTCSPYSALWMTG